MKVTFSTPKFQTIYNKPDTRITKPSYKTNLQGPAKDTVSFSGVSAGKKIVDHLTAQYIAENPRLLRLATTYLDILESVVIKLKDEGFSMNRAYCEKHPVKTVESYKSKVVRSGKLNVPDLIRATIYCDDIYNISKLTDCLLPEMEKRGYVLAPTERHVSELMKFGFVPSEKEAEIMNNIRSGLYTTQEELFAAKEQLIKMVPDLDIRLKDDTAQEITSKSIVEQIIDRKPQLKYCIGKPQESGYEDIQMRFVRNYTKEKHPTQYELIVLLGPNTCKAKDRESGEVYKFLRMFKELSTDLSDNTVGSNSYKAKAYMNLLQEMFRGKVSKKLFLNAKNKDLYDIPDEIPIYFSETDQALFENYFKGLKTRIHNIYREKGKENLPKIVTTQLGKDKKKDKDIIDEIHKGLKDTIDRFNYENDLKS